MLLVALFIVGYLAIVFEHPLRLNKAASALLTGVACWTAYIVTGDHHAINEQLLQQMGELSQILFFLLGAMTIVELVDAYDGFEIITSRIRTRSRRKLLLAISLLSFGLSAVLDNLTASIVMISLVRKLVSDDTDRMYYAGVVIVAANSGGAWSPIGDVTTTMLWIGGQITTRGVVTHVLLPSLIGVAVPVLLIALRMKGDVARRAPQDSEAIMPIPPPLTPGLTASRPPDDATAIGRSLAPGQTTLLERRIVLVAGIAVLLFVPIFKYITNLPPFMGMLLGLGALWTLTEVIHKKRADESKGPLSVTSALRRIDAESILFFLGILLAIGALQHGGILAALATWMDRTIGNVNVITVSIGLASAVVDNVPLVAAVQRMYPLSAFPTDHHFWLFLCYCAGTGGSLLIIGSAAGIAVMGIQRITFGWYVRHLSLPALVGYAAGAATYLAMAAARQ